MQQVNEAKLATAGLAYSGAQYTWEIFMVSLDLIYCFPHANKNSVQWYASYMSCYVWAGLFLGPKIKRIWAAKRSKQEYHKDRLL